MSGHTALLRLGVPMRVVAEVIGVSVSLASMWRARWRVPSYVRRLQLELAFGIPADSWTRRGR